MLNKKGFTLVELLAMMVVLGIIMVTIIPNIVGISNSNRLQTYAEDAKKFKSIVEYKMRSDNTYMRPSSTHCVAYTLENVAGSEFDKGPYGGTYLTSASYVVISMSSDEYKYFVQLIEQLPNGDGYRGFALRSIESIEGKNYLNEYQDYNGVYYPTLWESETLPNEMKLSWNGDRVVDDAEQGDYLLNRTPLCMLTYVDKTNTW